MQALHTYLVKKTVQVYSELYPDADTQELYDHLSKYNDRYVYNRLKKLRYEQSKLRAKGLN